MFEGISESFCLHLMHPSVICSFVPQEFTSSHHHPSLEDESIVSVCIVPEFAAPPPPLITGQNANVHVPPDNIGIIPLPNSNFELIWQSCIYDGNGHWIRTWKSVTELKLIGFFTSLSLSCQCACVPCARYVGVCVALSPLLPTR